eukprot:767673-Hanusia_phi.AAC.2
MLLICLLFGVSVTFSTDQNQAATVPPLTNAEDLLLSGIIVRNDGHKNGVLKEGQSSKLHSLPVVEGHLLSKTHKSQAEKAQAEKSQKMSLPSVHQVLKAPVASLKDAKMVKTLSAGPLHSTNVVEEKTHGIAAKHDNVGSAKSQVTKGAKIPMKQAHTENESEKSHPLRQKISESSTAKKA